jgi:exodeoxyribonuclease-3
MGSPEGAGVMKVFAWNIRQGGRKNREHIVARCRHHDADVIVLTEFRCNDVGAYLSETLRGWGWAHQATGLADRRTNTNFIASRRPLERIRPLNRELEKPHRMLDARIAGLQLTAVHMPNLREKFPYWEAVIRAGRRRRHEDALFVGDFNTGRHYLDEPGATFVATEHLARFERLGFVDVWRQANPDGREYSWYSPQAKNGFRLDHAFASPPLSARVTAIRYSHEERERRLSDHSALVIAWDE